jgi:group I intron endonuclease
MQIPKNFGLKISGIYKITNIINNKFYIGSSNDIYHRLKHHYSDLKNNKHHNKYLLRSFKKHGKNNFKVEIIEKVEQKLLIKREQYYIDILKPEYNLILDVVGNKLTESSKKQISKTLKNKYLNGELLVKNSTDIENIIIYDKNCKCFDTYKSRKEAAKALLLLYPNLKLSTLEIKIRSLIRNYRENSRSKFGVFKNHYILKEETPCLVIEKLAPVRTPVQSECIITKEIIKHNSVTDCVKFFKSSKVTIYSRIKSGELLNKRYKLTLIKK